jgi:hypothetical protein
MKVYFAVGNAEDAQRAVLGELAQIGSGLHRKAFVDAAEKTVYKIPSGWRNAEDAQTTEYCTARQMLADNVRGVPPVEMYVVSDDAGRAVPVIAMPYFARNAGTATWDEKEVQYGREHVWREYVRDLHDANWRLNRRGKPVVTDMGLAATAHADEIPDTLESPDWGDTPWLDS